MKPFRSIKGKLIIFALCISLIPITVITVIYYFNSRNTVMNQILNDLTAIAESKKMHLLSYLESKKGRLIDFSSDGFIRDCAQKITMKEDWNEYYNSLLSKHLIDNKKSVSPDILEVFIVGFDGKVIASTDKNHSGNDVSNESYFTEVEFLSPLAGSSYYDVHLNENVIDFSSVLLSKVGREAIGIIVNRIKFGRQENIGQGDTLSQQNNDWDYSQLIAVNKARIIDFSSDGFIRDCTENIIRRDDKVQYYTGLLNSHLAINKQPLDNDILAVFIVDLVGRVISSSEFGLLGGDVSSKAYYLEAMKLGFSMSGLHYSSVAKQGSFEMAKLLYTKDSRNVAGIIVNRYNGKSLGNILLSEISGELRRGRQQGELGETGELYLVNRDKLMITDSRFIDDAPFRQVVDTKPVRKIINEGKEMAGLYHDYRDVLVVGASVDILEHDWILLAEIDKSEAFAPIRIVGIIALVAGGACSAVAIFVGVAFSLTATRPISKLKYAADKFAKGDMDYRVSIINKDEIGDLAASFNNMAAELKMLTVSLEKKIAERTENLSTVNKKLLGEIAERKLTEEELRKLTRAVEQSPAAVVITDTSGNIEYVNPKFYQTTGYTPEETIGKNPRILKSGKQKSEVYKKLWDTITSGNEWHGEFHNKRKNGELYWEFASISPIRNTEDVITHFIAVKEDITRRKQMEGELHELNKSLEGRILERTEELRKMNEHLQNEITEHKRAEDELTATNKELEAFCYSVSHDLRAPLRSIDGFSKALVEDFGDKLDSHGKDYVVRVRKASQRMGQLISDLLSLSRITRSELHHEKVDLSVIAHKVVTELRKMDPERQTEFVIQDGIVVDGDARLLLIVMENLLFNAWKFTGKQSVSQIEFGIKENEEESVYFVSDDGAGFDMAYANKLFGAFQRLHSSAEFEGTGIGLATVQRVIHRHGGRIWAEGVVGQGATFYFTI